MDINVIKASKDELEAELGNVTMAEILRVYLSKDASVSFVAWKRVHLIEKPILKVKTKGKTAKKAISDAVLALTNDLDKTLAEFKKLK